MRDDEIVDAPLNFRQILKRLRHRDDRPVHAHGMDGHGGRRRDKAALRRDRERNADRMPAAEHQRHGGLCHARNQLRDGKSGFHIAAYGI